MHFKYCNKIVILLKSVYLLENYVDMPVTHPLLVKALHSCSKQSVVSQGCVRSSRTVFLLLKDEEIFPSKPIHIKPIRIQDSSPDSDLPIHKKILL